MATGQPVISAWALIFRAGFRYKTGKFRDLRLYILRSFSSSSYLPILLCASFLNTYCCCLYWVLFSISPVNANPYLLCPKKHRSSSPLMAILFISPIRIPFISITLHRSLHILVALIRFILSNSYCRYCNPIARRRIATII